MAVALRKTTYHNPVFPGYFADPFVFKFEGVYYAVGTGAHEANGDLGDQVFPMLQSPDFFHWVSAGNAMWRPDGALGTHFWAPEIAWAEGKFHLYYSVGFEDKNHQLRVASSDFPSGPFIDLGKSLLAPERCAFAIDPHPFRDDDGRWFLFYARDFLDCGAGACAGTGLMVARMRTLTELADEGTLVLRPRHAWQRFEKDRLMYGRRWDWHTLEGPCVRKHAGRYYCFFSAGRWENETYGVDYAVADSVLGPYVAAGNESGPRVLRTVPDRVLGPGHNSIVLGPDDRTEYLVYHAWDRHKTARRMFLDPLDWTAEGPRCHGPTCPE
jgi:beta-xylosidase